jgi:N-acetylmuramic acid 6-phosphate etherase
MEENLFDEISGLDTEIIDNQFADIDTMNTANILALINQQDQLVPLAVKEIIPTLAVVVDKCVECFNNGGRLIYVGAGTSGRLGILDASECPPTFGTELHMVQGHIAGGKDAVFQAIEGAEDNEEDGKNKIIELNVGNNDVVCGLTASGRTPWVLSALKQAGLQGSFTCLITTNANKNYDELDFIDKIICVKVGAEVIAGSTRMKSGTAQKLILNMLTTTSMLQLGKTYKNIMIDLQAKNNKLKERAKRILMTIVGIDKEKAEQILLETGYNVKIALFKILYGLNNDEAVIHIKENKGKIRK